MDFTEADWSAQSSDDEIIIDFPMMKCLLCNSHRVQRLGEYHLTYAAGHFKTLCALK